MHHGSFRSDITPHLGFCLTDDADTAACYATDRGYLATINLDLAGLTVTHLDGYDAETNWAPGDDHEHHDADVIAYDDADENGRRHQTWRLVSAAAVAACTVTTVVAVEDLED